MKVILNTHAGSTTFNQALKELVVGAETLSVAVSYIQVGGWEGLKETAKGLDFPRMRIVCTDQFGITQPAAVRLALESQVQIRRFSGKGVYHPKVFLAHGRNGRPTRFLIGSANLSTSAFSTSVEAGVLGDGHASLNKISSWFDNLFSKEADKFTAALLDEMDISWRLAAAARIKGRLQTRASSKKMKPESILEAEDLDALDDVLATIESPFGLLNLDCARNYVRSISLARRLLSASPPTDSKAKSELRFLGLMDENEFTKLGIRASHAESDEEFANIWCGWLKRTPDEQLREMNPRLVAAKRALMRFWSLQPEVREYFLTHVHEKGSRKLLQAIELLCNGSRVVSELSLSEIQVLATLLWEKSLPSHLRKDIEEYKENKGTRGWDNNDRVLIPRAWARA